MGYVLSWANTPISGILQQVAERAPQVPAISATMTFHIHAVADLIAATRAAGNAPRILVGRGAFNSVPVLWKDVGAEGYAADAVAVATLVRITPASSGSAGVALLCGSEGTLSKFCATGLEWRIVVPPGIRSAPAWTQAALR